MVLDEFVQRIVSLPDENARNILTLLCTDEQKVQLKEADKIKRYQPYLEVEQIAQKFGLAINELARVMENVLGFGSLHLTPDEFYITRNGRTLYSMPLLQKAINEKLVEEGIVDDK